MSWLAVIVAALACWLGCILYAAVRKLKEGRRPAEKRVCLLMGEQAGVAEWFLRSVYSIEGVRTGRLAVTVAAVAASGDMAGILGILARQKGYCLAGPGPWPPPGPEGGPAGIMLDVRGMDVPGLEAVLRNLRAL